jgi:Domain of unknown function (DUF4355)
MSLQTYYENKKHFASALNTPYLLRSNLQFFSDPGGAGEGGDGGTGSAGEGGAAGTGTEGGDGGESKLSFTQEEYDKKLQEGIATELEKQKETWRKELEETMKKERKEAEELAKLSAEERAKVEQEKAKLKLDEEKAALDKEKLDFQREKLFLQTEKILSEEKLDTRLAPFLIGEDADSTHKNIQLYKEVHKEAVRNEVADVLKGKKQLVGGGANLSEIEQLEQQRLDALQKRDMPRAIALKNQIFNLQNK